MSYRIERLSGSTATISDEEAVEMAMTFHGDLLGPGDPGYEVAGLDLTPAMQEGLEENAGRMGAENVRALDGNAESIPLPDASVDVVISNGVLNLVPDKPAAAAEIHRVLRPGGAPAAGRHRALQGAVGGVPPEAGAVGRVYRRRHEGGRVSGSLL